MSQPSPRNVIHSLDLMKQMTRDTGLPSTGKCGGDCANCPCSEESPKSTKKASEQETSESCDKC